jgi:hypothetical protein
MQLSSYFKLSLSPRSSVRLLLVFDINLTEKTSQVTETWKANSYSDDQEITCEIPVS